MTTTAGALVIGVAGLGEFEADARLTQVTEVEDVVGAMAGAGSRLLEIRATARPVRGMMLHQRGDGEALGATMAGAPGRCPGRWVGCASAPVLEGCALAAG